ncbi:MAG: TRAP transporter small permease [Planctomycetota bacterium]
MTPEPPIIACCRRVDRWIQRVEVALCVLALAIMILLAFGQVALRQFSGASLGPFSVPQPVAWFDIVARHMVIWVGVLGASLATAEGRHISIEALPKLLGDRGRRRLDVLVSGASLFVTAILLVLAVMYLGFQFERRHDQSLFALGAVSVPRWPFLVVVPAGLLLMCWRFGLRVLEALLLDDEAHAALRTEETAEAEQEVEQRRAEQSERLIRESKRYGYAREEPAVEDAAALAEDAPPAEDPPPGAPQVLEAQPERPAAAPPPPSPAPPTATDEDDLGGDESEEEARLPPRVAPKKGPTRALRSTDEIPIYQDLADDEDLVEPEVTRGRAIADSSDELESVEGIEDLVGDARYGRDAEEAIEAMARSTDRMTPPSDEDLISDALGRSVTKASTDRLEPSDRGEVEEDRDALDDEEMIDSTEEEEGRARPPSEDADGGGDGDGDGPEDGA